MNTRFRSRMFLGAALWLLTVGVASAHLTDANSYPPVTYSGVPAGMGQTYTDPIFGTAIKRLSDAVGSPDVGTSGLPWVMTEYSTMAAFNQDDSRLLLQHGSYFGLHDGAGNFIRLLPAEINAGSEPRWARRDPAVIYFLNGNSLKQHNVNSGATSVVHTFSEYSSITGKGESDICFDGDHFVFAGDNRDVFVYEISSGSKGGVLNTGGRGIDSLYITPDDHVTVTWLQAGGGRYNGIEMFDRNMQFLRQLTRAGGHMDVGRDGNGDEVLLWANAADPAPVCNNGVVKVRLADARQTCLISLDWSLALNVSATDNSGWVYVATYAPADPNPIGGSWPAYTNELLQVSLDGSQVRRLAHHRSRPFNGYNYTPRPSVSRDGSKLVFSSNFGMQQSGYPTEYADAYLIDDLVSGGSATGGGGGGGGNTGGGDTGGGNTGGGDTGGGNTGGGSGGGGNGGDNGAAPLAGAVTRVEEDGPGIAYQGAWYPNGSGQHSSARAVLSMEAGARATFTFSGVGASWIAYRDSWSGIAEVYVDGKFVDTLDTYAKPAQPQGVMYSVQGLPDGAHTLEVRATGRRNGNAGGAWIWVDAFERIAAGSAPPPSGGGGNGGGGGGGGNGGGGGGPSGNTLLVEDTDSNVTFTGGWFNNSTAGHSGGSAKMGLTAGERATLRFTGTGVTWIAYRDEWSGIARVYLDGQMVGEVDTYVTPAQAQASMYTITGLAWGSHEVVIEATQRQNPRSGGAWVWVDAFRVLQ